MSVIKVLCTADLHLGRSSACLIAPPGVDISAIGAWQRIVLRAIEERADLVAIAGDVFDSLPGYYETRKAFGEGLDKLAEHGIPTVAIAGNHDCQALARFGKHYSGKSFFLLGLTGWQHVDLLTKNGELTVIGWSFPSSTFPHRAFDEYRPPATPHPVLGLVHGDLAPVTQYHPIHISDLDSYADAWILGHIHLPRLVNARAVYPGSPQALDFGPGERGPHGFYWLHLAPGEARFSDLEICSTVLFDAHPLQVPPSVGLDPFTAGQIESGRRIAEIRSAHPGIQSAQTRFNVTFHGIDSVPKFDPQNEVTSNGDAYLWTDLRLGYDQDPWQDASVSDVYGEAARLLLGARAVEGQDGGRAVEPDWTARAAQEIERIASGIEPSFRATIGKATDSGEGERIPPSETEAWAIAQEAFIAYLEQFLRERAGSQA